MTITRTQAQISLDMINNYVREADNALTATAREQWLRRAQSERNALERKVKIEQFLDEIFGPKEHNGQA